MAIPPIPPNPSPFKKTFLPSQGVHVLSPKPNSETIFFGGTPAPIGSTDVNGSAVLILGGAGTGSGSGGALIFGVHPAGSSGSDHNGATEAFTIDGDTIETNFYGSTIFNANVTAIAQASIQPNAIVSNTPYAMVADSPATNLIPNPSFEVDLTGWNDVVSATSTRVTSQKWSGDASMQTVFHTTTASGVRTDTIPVSANTVYTFSVFLKGNAGGERVYLTLEGNNSGATDSNNNALMSYDGIAGTALTTEWKRYIIRKTTNASDTTLRAYVRVTGTGGGTIFIDGAQLEVRGALGGDVSASTYLDGSLGHGYSWSGTEHNSSSTRAAGMHFLAPLDERGTAFAMRPDGSFAGRQLWRADNALMTTMSFTSGVDQEEPYFPFEFNGDFRTAVFDDTNIPLGLAAGVLRVSNDGAGAALYVASAVDSDIGAVFDFSSLTTGTGIAIFLPEDISTARSGGAHFFNFLSKAGDSLWGWQADKMRGGNVADLYAKTARLFSGGNSTTTLTSAKTGTVAINGTTTLTGTGTSFLTDFRVGQIIVVNYFGNQAKQITAIASDTSLTVSSAFSGTASGRPYYGYVTQNDQQAVWWLEGVYYANHNNADFPAPGYFYGLAAEGSTGQPFWFESATKTSDPTAPEEGEGWAIPVRKYTDTAGTAFTNTTTETNIYTGYTIRGYELDTDKICETQIGGTFNADATASELTFRIGLDGVAVLTSNAKSIPNTNIWNFEATVKIIGVTVQSQIIQLTCHAEDSAGNELKWVEYATATEDLRTDTTLVITAQFSTNNGDLSREWGFTRMI